MYYRKKKKKKGEGRKLHSPLVSFWVGVPPQKKNERGREKEKASEKRKKGEKAGRFGGNVMFSCVLFGCRRGCFYRGRKKEKGFPRGGEGGGKGKRRGRNPGGAFTHAGAVDPAGPEKKKKKKKKEVGKEKRQEKGGGRDPRLVLLFPFTTWGDGGEEGKGKKPCGGKKREKGRCRRWPTCLFLVALPPLPGKGEKKERRGPRQRGGGKEKPFELRVVLTFLFCGGRSRRGEKKKKKGTEGRNGRRRERRLKRGGGKE